MKARVKLVCFCILPVGCLAYRAIVFFLVSRIVLCSSCSGAAGSIHIELPGAEQRLYTSVFPLREVSLVFGCLFFMCWVHGGQAVAK